MLKTKVGDGKLEVALQIVGSSKFASITHIEKELSIRLSLEELRNLGELIRQVANDWLDLE